MGELWMGCVPNMSERVLSALYRPEPDHRGETFGPLLDRIIKKVQQVMQTENDIAVMTSSGTGGLEAIGINFFKPGDNVIVPTCGLFSRLLCEYVRNAGATPIKVEAPVGDEPPFKDIENAFNQAGKVKAFFSVYDETATGITFTWFDQIGALCRKHDALFLVDAHAIMSVINLPVDKWGIDCCVCVSQIGMGGPTGLCFVSVSGRAKKYLENNPPKSVYFNIPLYLRWHSIGQPAHTPATIIMLATDEGLNMVLEEGLEMRFKRCEIIAKAFYAAFDSIGVETLTKKKELRSNLMLAFKCPPGIDESEFRKLLDNKYGIYVYHAVQGCPPLWRLGTIGPDPVFREGRVIATVACISLVLNVMGYKNNVGKAIEAAHEVLKGYPSWGTKKYSPIPWEQPRSILKCLKIDD
jgi:aspartate aminotransferase-like enzyme